MHPLLNVRLAEAIMEERSRAAEERRRLRQAPVERSSAPQISAPWPSGWSVHQPTLRSE
jgi:hypothetical protein